MQPGNVPQTTEQPKGEFWQLVQGIGDIFEHTDPSREQRRYGYTCQYETEYPAPEAYTMRKYIGEQKTAKGTHRSHSLHHPGCVAQVEHCKTRTECRALRAPQKSGFHQGICKEHLKHLPRRSQGHAEQKRNQKPRQPKVHYDITCKCVLSKRKRRDKSSRGIPSEKQGEHAHRHETQYYEDQYLTRSRRRPAGIPEHGRSLSRQGRSPPSMTWMYRL